MHVTVNEQKRQRAAQLALFPGFPSLAVLSIFVHVRGEPQVTMQLDASLPHGRGYEKWTNKLTENHL